MKEAELKLIGQSTKTGKLRLNTLLLSEFSKMWPNQQFDVTIKVKQKDSSDALCWYYLNHIVPQFQKFFIDSGERLTLQATDEKLRKMTTVMHEELIDEEAWRFGLVRILTVKEAGNSRTLEFIEELKILAAEFGVVIQDERKQFSNK